MPFPERPAACWTLAERGRRAARLFSPTVVALVGPVNAGKSTLFNVLMGRDEAVVSEAPGTTRDAIAGHGSVGGWPVLLVDTAGERELSPDALRLDAHARIEAEGMGLARRAAARADIVLEVRPAGSVAELPGPASPGRIPIWSRADEALGPDPSAWPPGFVAAQPQPEHARTALASAWANALGLESSAAEFARGLMGLGVPFEPEMIVRLEAAADRREGAAAIDAADLGPF